MAKYLLKTCCGCGSLRTGTIISGIAAILLSIIGIIVVFTIRVDLKTIVFDFLPKWAVTVIIVLNMVMTIILSILLLAGVAKRNWYLMIPWIVLGGMLAVGLLVSILINSIKFYIDGDNLNGTLWLVLGLLSLGKCRLEAIFSANFHSRFPVVYCYMWYVSFSFFSNLREESGKGKYMRDPFRRERI
ncbi:unnamed protein product [Phyllotreta striolata]|uniref:Uncharacterized protein n=1 Tax=Phyllotreta striolata TaxID=444603 RepID=A0A9P0DTG0_PHYSR|nr:unnamed protein product [Phyllotreta striolata]